MTTRERTVVISAMLLVGWISACSKPAEAPTLEPAPEATPESEVRPAERTLVSKPDEQSGSTKLPEPEWPSDAKPEAPEPVAEPPPEEPPTKDGDAKRLITNGGFENKVESAADGWFADAGEPIRTDKEAHRGKFCLHSSLANKDATPSENLLIQSFFGVTGGETYTFRFWAKQQSFGVGYVQEYEVKWTDGSGEPLGSGRELKGFKGGDGVWRELSFPGLEAPPEARGARIAFRFVTGALAGCAGEVFIDDVALVLAEE